ncbi:MAG: RNA 2'-phosphotransferase [Akkermansiaceae bacterium]|jgi:putative RNA 2'-phosphotransferase|nr:RNA 2'-phosphotransferase [Akkermansiaceae bacterium]
MDHKRISKFLSLVLRHDPARIGIHLDEQGWTDSAKLIEACNGNGVPIDFPLLEEIVRSSDKQRFALNDDKSRIRANQGHSVTVDLDLEKIRPPRHLFHGTVEKYLESIREKGLKKGERHHVHLSADIDTALKVGERRGRPILLVINAQEMHEQGHEFHRSANGVWLVDHASASFIRFNVRTSVLYRPVGPEELALIEASGWSAFPPRLPDQPIFYPVTNEAYAIQIARDWNVKASGSGYVTKFHVDADFLSRYPVQVVGGREHAEHWIPAEELEEFNHHILGPITITRSYPE